MNFEKVIKYRQEYPMLSGNKDALYDAIVDNSYDSDYALLTMGVINKKSKELFENRYTDMIIQIPSPFASTGTNFILLHFTKTKPEKLLTGIFKGKVCEKKDKHISCDSDCYMIGETTEDFNDFINNINAFINDDDVKRNDLNINDYSAFEIEHINPVYYTKQAIKIREELQKKDYKLLKEIADIVTTPTIQNIEAKYIDFNHFEYPLKYEELPVAKIPRAINLKKGDIVGSLVGEQPKFYIYNNDSDNIYIKAGNYCIIRVKDKNFNNYLVSYLNDEKARMYFTSNKRGLITTLNDIAELKVIIPTTEMIKNANEAMEYTMNSKKIITSDINELIRNSYKNNLENESQRMINDDIISAISKMKNKAIRDLINDDLNELDVCFDNKAYKCAFIMCGSILEAILLDWLAEYENTDDILNVAKSEDGYDLELRKIIDKLRKVIRPYWYESRKAHEIRKKRNMVHPKQCIKNNTKITCDECEKIIADLYDIIESKESRR